MAALPEQLWKLQSELSRLHELERGLSERPAGFAEVDDRLHQAQQALTALRAKADESQKQRRELDRELQVEQEALNRYQGQLMQVKNQQQYAAAWKEIDMARRKVKELEDAALQRMQELEEIEGKISEGERELEPLEQEHKASYESWQSSLGDLRSEAEEVRKRIEEIGKTVPPAVLREFHRVAEQRGGVAMARVTRSSCEGCRVNIRPALYQQLRRGELTRCEGCRRMLFVETETVAAK